MWRYFELLSFRPLSEINQWQIACGQGENPRTYKVLLAQEIITRFHDKAAAKKALEDFEARFQRGAIPAEMAEINIKIEEKGWGIANILKESGLVKSTSEGMRMIKQGAVKIDGEKISDPKRMLNNGDSGVYQVGKRKFARITLTRVL
jgi:tyrosyl-tRNA synthetase